MDIKLRKIDKYIWEIPKEGKMNVPVRIYASDKLIEKMKEDRTLIQARNVSMLPKIVKHMVVMPDGHEGYGPPIGGVGAFSLDNPPVIPGFVGFDINCGVRLLRTNLTIDEIKDRLNLLVNEIFRNVPAGVGEGGKLKLSIDELNKVLDYGVNWAIDNGFGWEEDRNRIESHGYLDFADSDAVSNTAKQRGKDQLGTIGSGNHFLEIQVVDQIYDEEIAKAFGIYEKNQVTVLIHTGSRGLGHQVASDYLRLFEKKYKYDVPDRELIYAPYDSKDAQNYLKAMAAAANFAWANRQLITYWVRKSFEKVLRKNIESIGLEIVYDLAHNIAKFEEHTIDGKKQKLIVYRKGATRAFPPGHKELWGEYKKYGQPVIIPGSMGTASYLLVGQPKAMELSFGSSAHGAGRVKAKKLYSYSEVIRKLREMGIIVKSTTKTGVLEEIPEAYKDIDEVVRVTHELGISKIVARFRPVAVIKG